jgi:hypothetical protein
MPGKFRGKFWNAGSVYLDEETFTLIAKPLLRHVPELDYFGTTVIRHPLWEKIIEGLEALAIRVSKSADLSELEADLVFWQRVPDDYSATRAEFQRDFADNAKALVAVITELVTWLRETLKTEEYVSVLGV